MPKSNQLLSFNSILVRLKAWIVCYRDENKCCFNSILVRLKGEPKNLDLRVWDQFQFHTGSIKRVWWHRFRWVRRSFNSILVRLKALASRSADAPSELFQFHTGSIKRYLPSLHISSIYSFQFHTGSIKRTQPFLPTLCTQQVSIPYWFD